MHMVQDSIYASGLEIKQVQVGPRHLSGEVKSLTFLRSYLLPPGLAGLA